MDTTSLENWLWEAACVIRGPLDAPKFKDYILPLIFLKRLSDVFDDEVAHLAEEFGDRDTAARLVEQDHKLVRFYIPPNARWGKIATTTTGLGQFLTDAVRAVAREPGAVYEITADTLQAIASREEPDTVKVFNLLKAIEQLIADHAAHEPYLVSIGDKAEQIARAFEERQRTTQETLEQLRRLIREIADARQERDGAGLPPEAFAVYWLLKRDGVAQAQAVAQAVGEAFAAYPHWHTSSHQEQEVRKALYKALIDAGVDGVVDVAKHLLRMLRRATE